MTRVAVTGDFVSLSHGFAQRFLRRLFPLQRFSALPRIYEASAATGRLLSASCTNVAETLLLRVRVSEVAVIAAGLSAAGQLRDEVSHHCAQSRCVDYLFIFKFGCAIISGPLFSCDTTAPHFAGASSTLSRFLPLGACHLDLQMQLWPESIAVIVAAFRL
jgi:hypothetical protein